MKKLFLFALMFLFQITAPIIFEITPENRGQAHADYKAKLKREKEEELERELEREKQYALANKQGSDFEYLRLCRLLLFSREKCYLERIWHSWWEGSCEPSSDIRVCRSRPHSIGTRFDAFFDLERGRVRREIEKWLNQLDLTLTEKKAFKAIALDGSPGKIIRDGDKLIIKTGCY